MSNWLNRLGRFAAVRRWLVVAGWVVVAVAIVLGNRFGGGGTVDNFEVPGVESQQAVDLLKEQFPQRSGATAMVVFHADSGSVTDADAAAGIAATVERVRALDHFLAVTEPLAGRCERLLSSDGSPSAVATCRARPAQSPNGEGVVVDVGEVPDDWPHEQFDLVVFSELGYYLTATALDETLRRAVRSMEQDATLLAVHWRHRADDFVLDGGDEVHRHIAATAGLDMTARYLDDDFRAETFVRKR